MEKLMNLNTAIEILKENHYLVEARPRPYRTTRYERDYKYINPNPPDREWTNDDEIESARGDIARKMDIFNKAGGVKSVTGRKRAILEDLYRYLMNERELLGYFSTDLIDDRLIIGPILDFARGNEYLDNFVEVDVSDIFPEYKTKNSTPIIYKTNGYFMVMVAEFHIEDINLSDSVTTILDKILDVPIDLASQLSNKELRTRLEDLKNRCRILYKAYGYNARNGYDDFRGYTTEKMRQYLRNR